MPLIDKLQIDYPHSYTVGVWKIDESVDCLREMCHKANIDERAFTVIDGFKSVCRQLETLATYIVLYSLTSRKGLYIDHQSSGKPIVEGLNISISHTKGYAAVIISEKAAVGIDIEYISERVRKVKDWFLRQDEFAHSTNDMLVQWCGKETAFKLLSSSSSFTDYLSYYNERSIDAGHFTIKSETDGFTVDINVNINDFYVLTYSCGKIFS